MISVSAKLLFLITLNKKPTIHVKDIQNMINRSEELGGKKLCLNKISFKTKIDKTEKKLKTKNRRRRITLLDFFLCDSLEPRPHLNLL